MQKFRLVSAAVRTIWGFGSPKLALLCWGPVTEGDKPNTVYVAKLSVPEVFQTSAQLHSGSCMPQTSPQFRDSLLLLPANPALPARDTEDK